MPDPREDPLERLAATRIAECMSRDPVVVNVTDSCQWALSVMSAAGVRRLPVLDEGRLVGMVTECDVLRRAPVNLGEARPATWSSSILEETSVSGVMTYGPSTVSPDGSLARAASLMVEQHVGALPVVEDGRLVGIVTREDVLERVTSAFPAAPL